MFDVVRSVCSNIRTQGVFKYGENVVRAEKIFTDSLPKLPDPLIPVWEKEGPLPSRYETAYHGTALSRVQSQIEKGVLEGRMDFFFFTWNPAVANLYTYSRQSPTEKPIVLKIAYDRKYEFYHSLFSTTYTMPTDNNVVYIIGVLERNPEYTEATSPENIEKYSPPFRKMIREVDKIASELYKKDPKE